MDDVFVIPVRLDACEVPKRVADHLQYIDLFPDFESGIRAITRVIRKQSAAKRKRQLLLAG